MGEGMELALLVLLGLAAGAGLPVQASVNSALRTHLGRPEWATLVNFACGTVVMATVLLLQRATVPSGAQASAAPWWSWTGGALGAFFVFSAVVLTPRLGLATSATLFVAGQSIAALALDHAGAFGLAQRAATPARLLGAALLVAGVVLVRR
jgi:transporter family-2 protein